MPSNIPKFTDLPLHENDPPYSAWGLYGKDDELGTLNRLTPDIVLNASKLIKTGKRINLDLPLDHQKDLPFFGRQGFHKHVFRKGDRYVNDDVWTFNTQSSSQWDGLRHFGYQELKAFYGGVKMEDIHSSPDYDRLGVHNQAQAGIIGRGILLDYHTWRQENNVPFEAFKTNSIKLEHLKTVANDQGTSIEFGDILFIRSGYGVEFNKASKEYLKSIHKILPPSFPGVEQSKDMLEWIWNNFSAVAGDMPAFEAYPMQHPDIKLHEVLLGGWGMPIGELFDLDVLAEECQKQKRWEFFLTSKPCNVPGGVASPPNAMAIF